MAVDIKDASHEDIFHMACIGELSLDQFEQWLDYLKTGKFEDGYQSGFSDGQENS